MTIEQTRTGHAMIDALPTQQQHVLLLRLVRGLSADETARILLTSPLSVVRAQHAALNGLRRQIARPTTARP
ncbi:sigma factor-like helix-turn-helix DNA-binding protein [Rhodococcus sp. NPDC059234]|uniref:sigma factor-like helix-turn-helix DNA-binding protein n=1 Tax=Rhodococcus sp. NPDC059234 TaxID=3346781 RepID=UPI0036703A85